MRHLTVLGHGLVELSAEEARLYDVPAEGKRVYVNAETLGADGLTFSSVEDFLVQWCLDPGGITLRRLQEVVNAYCAQATLGTFGRPDVPELVRLLRAGEHRRLADRLLDYPTTAFAVGDLLRALAATPVTPEQMLTIADELP